MYRRNQGPRRKKMTRGRKKGVRGRKLGVVKTSIVSPSFEIGGSSPSSTGPSSSRGRRRRKNPNMISKRGGLSRPSAMSSSKEQPVKRKGWLKLETDYKKLNQLLKLLGVDGDFEFSDLLGFDEELCNFVPKPVLAVILCHPVLPNLTLEKNQEDENPQIYQFNNPEHNEDVFFLYQRIFNSCGTLALIHSVLNQLRYGSDPKYRIGVKNESPLYEYFEKTKGMSPLERGNALRKFKNIEQAHQKVASIGLRKQGPKRKRKGKRKKRPVVHKHFTCFILHEETKTILELDGTRKWPIQRGHSSRDDFLVNVCRVILLQYVSKCPTNPYDFAAIVLRRKG